MPAFLDLHAHYLAGVDDGATDLDMSVQMVKATRALGFTDVYATPHQRDGLFLPTAEQIATAFRALEAALAGAGERAGALGLAAENFWDGVFLERTRARAVPSFGGGPAFLFEVQPQIMPGGLEAALFDMRIRGALPVMAHPERYTAIQQSLDRAAAVGRTAALVIDLGALDGAHGKLPMRTARQLVLEGLVHAAATDIHRPEDQAPIAAGMAWLKKQIGPAGLEALLSENPRRIVAGELPEPWR